MSELIERVARSLYETETGRSDWGEETEWMDGRQRTYWCDMARAAILAMKPPTEAMVERAQNHLSGHSHGTISYVYTAMIDVALLEDRA